MPKRVDLGVLRTTTGRRRLAVGLAVGLAVELGGGLVVVLAIGLAGGLAFRLTFGLVGVLAFALATQPVANKIPRRVVSQGPVQTAFDVAVGLVFGLSGVLAFGLAVGLVVGLAGVLAFGLSGVLVFRACVRARECLRFAVAALRGRLPAAGPAG